jgi:hypothetical protein
MVAMTARRRWLQITALGAPVEPEVKSSNRRSEPLTSAIGSSAPLRAAIDAA